MSSVQPLEWKTICNFKKNGRLHPNLLFLLSSSGKQDYERYSMLLNSALLSGVIFILLRYGLSYL
jgi:hypothetical protein